LHKFRPKTLFVGQKINYLPTCQSTNDIAAELVETEQAIEGLVILTDYQTSGRGQRGNLWEAAPGQNLTFSLILHPTFLRASEQFWLNIAISLGVSDWLSAYLPERTTVKWPNDLYVGDRKIGGILIENTLQGYQLAWAVVGIGLNINQLQFPYPTATSLLLETQNRGEFVREDLLNTLLVCLEQRYISLRSGQREALRASYLQRLFRYQEEHWFQSEEERFRGYIVGIDETGRLALQVGGQLRYYGFKEVAFVI